MRIGIPLRVAERGAVGHEAIERAFHVTRDIRIVALVNKNACGGMRNEEMADARGTT